MLEQLPFNAIISVFNAPLFSKAHVQLFGDTNVYSLSENSDTKAKRYIFVPYLPLNGTYEYLKVTY